MATNKLITNCREYSTSLNCLNCDGGFYVKANRCEAVEETIPNCKYYRGKTTCLECQLGYLLSLDYKLCEKIKTQPNCQGYTQGRCSECTETHFFNKNTHFEDLFQFQTQSQINNLSKFLLGSSKNEFNQFYAPSCQEIRVENCKVIKNAFECQECEENHFLTEDSKCQANPDAGVENCLRYSSISSCEECSFNFYLENSSTCSQITLIPNCIQYDGTASTTRCLECVSAMYSSESECLDRVDSKSISNCDQTDPFEDQCLECRDNYQLSFDKLSCLEKVSNCRTNKEYQDKMVCQECSDEFYLSDQDTCLRGQVSFCKEYLSDPNTCLTCKNEYYLENGLCKKHDPIAECETFSPSQANTCTSCGGNFYNYWVISRCKEYTQIPHCLEYNELPPIACNTCEKGYYLESNQCRLIQIPNCQEYEGGNCLECKSDYALFKGGSQITCAPIFSFVSFNCLKNNTENLEGVEEEDFINNIEVAQVECKQCQSFYYPQNLQDLFICVSEQELDYLQIQEQSIVQNCVKIDQNGVCKQCSETYFLDTALNQCVVSCPTLSYQLLGFSLQESDYVFENTRICVSMDGGEEILGVDLSQTSTNVTIPLKCLDDHLPTYLLNNLRYSNLDYSRAQSELVYDQEKIKFVFPAIEECIQRDSDSPKVPNCEFYQKLRISRTYVARCIKCSHGYTSKVTYENNSSS